MLLLLFLILQVVSPLLFTILQILLAAALSAITAWARLSTSHRHMHAAGCRKWAKINRGSRHDLAAAGQQQRGVETPPHLNESGVRPGRVGQLARMFERALLWMNTAPNVPGGDMARPALRIP
jgi:hypothetical protein